MKESILIFKKAPSGTSAYLKVLIARGYMLVIPLVGGATLGMCFISSRIGMWDSFVITAILVLMAMADVIIVIGLFLVNPAYSEKSPKLWLNIVLLIILHIAFFVVTFTMVLGDGGFLDPVTGLSPGLGILALITWLGAVGFLVLGRWKIKSIE